MMDSGAFNASGRIFHWISPRAGRVSDCLSHGLALSSDELLALIDLGAVYLNKRRVFVDAPLGAGDYVRLHLEPRRFSLPAARVSDLIVAQTDDFLVIDKPAGIPVHASLDNARENLLVALESRLGQTLYVTHRLDIPTQGLLLFAKHQAFQARFNRWLAERRVEKWYRALVERPVPIGSLIHYQKVEPYSPKQVSRSPVEGWRRCELTVLACERSRNKNVFEIILSLQTGRTHQIRCQLADIGSPILGDTLYGGTPVQSETIALQSHALFLPMRAMAWRLGRKW